MTPVLPILPLIFCLTAPGEEESPARRIGDEYVRTTFVERDLDASAQLLAEDVLFIDPTADLWGDLLASGITGRAAMLAKQRTFGALETSFERDIAFACGPYAVYAGRLDWTSSSQPPIQDLPFATILEVRKELVVGRRDYGDYDTLQPGKTSPDLASRARAYLEAYSAFDLELLHEFWHADVTFQDPTAAVNGQGQRAVGIDAVHAVVDGIVASNSVVDFAIEPELEFFSNHHAVFAGKARYTLTGAALGLELDQATFVQPMVVALEIRDGRVHEHLDYTDYTLFLKKLAELRAAQKDAK